MIIIKLQINIALDRFFVRGSSGYTMYNNNKQSFYDKIYDMNARLTQN